MITQAFDHFCGAIQRAQGAFADSRVANPLPCPANSRRRFQNTIRRRRSNKSSLVSPLAPQSSITSTLGKPHFRVFKVAGFRSTSNGTSNLNYLDLRQTLHPKKSRPKSKSCLGDRDCVVRGVWRLEPEVASHV